MHQIIEAFILLNLARNVYAAFIIMILEKGYVKPVIIHGL